MGWGNLDVFPYDESNEIEGDNHNNHSIDHDLDVVWHSCGMCSYETLYRYNLKRHKHDVHVFDAAWYNCDACSYKSKYKHNLKTHKETQHNQRSQHIKETI